MIPDAAMSHALAIILHLICINIWVGGSFFAVVVLYRAASHLEPGQQQLLMVTVLHRFFSWLWFVMLGLIVSGGWMIMSIFGGLAQAPLYVILMATLGLLMSCVFLVMFFGPYRRYRQIATLPDVSAGQRYLAMIRWLSTVNMVLGLCVVLVVGGGPHFLI